MYAPDYLLIISLCWSSSFGKLLLPKFNERMCEQFKTEKLRNACQRTYGSTHHAQLQSHAYMKSMKDLFKEYEVGKFMLSDLSTKLTSHRHQLSIQRNDADNGVGVSLRCRTNTPCPIPPNIPQNKENLRSSAPWDYCLHFKATRFPQWLNEAACLCKGCIDFNTGQHDRNVVSKPVTVMITVIMRSRAISSFAECTNLTCWEKQISVDVGCHCHIPTWPEH
ncbi:interleukin-17C-like [Styela clava]|uniref:uncharacterized protein LOC120343212 n=1 Tax=Styela clava TaxID=7725 RepID=UPI001939993A|nr:uncharacterized protein LOC120343212 [Styela clava]